MGEAGLRHSGGGTIAVVRNVISPLSNRHGKSRLGCLLTLVILVTIAYYGFDIGGVYLQRWQLKQEMKAQAGYAPSIDDNAIRRRLNRKIEELRLPEEAREELKIRRTLRPREITISTSYEVVLTLPFKNATVTFTVEITNPL